MNETTRQLFARAVDAIEAAEILATNGKIDFAAGRAYYAMFYTAEALLNEKGSQFGKQWKCHCRLRTAICKNERIGSKVSLLAAHVVRPKADRGLRL